MTNETTGRLSAGFDLQSRTTGDRWPVIARSQADLDCRHTGSVEARVGGPHYLGREGRPSQLPAENSRQPRIINISCYCRPSDYHLSTPPSRRASELFTLMKRCQILWQLRRPRLLVRALQSFWQSITRSLPSLSPTTSNGGYNISTSCTSSKT